MPEAQRIHFVTGDLQKELDRLGVTRTDECVNCGEFVPDAEVAELDHREGDLYETVCIWCIDSAIASNSEVTE